MEYWAKFITKFITTEAASVLIKNEEIWRFVRLL